MESGEKLYKNKKEPWSSGESKAKGKGKGGRAPRRESELGILIFLNVRLVSVGCQTLCVKIREMT